jgi:hypothetical protein
LGFRVIYKNKSINVILNAQWPIKSKQLCNKIPYKRKRKVYPESREISVLSKYFYIRMLFPLYMSIFRLINLLQQNFLQFLLHMHYPNFALFCEFRTFSAQNKPFLVLGMNKTTVWRVIEYYYNKVTLLNLWKTKIVF